MIRSYKKWLVVLLLCVFASGLLGAVVYWRRDRIKRKPRPQVLAAGEPRLVVQLAHSGGISSVAFSRDGRFIVSGGADMFTRGVSDKAAILWETGTGREIRRFVGHSESVNAVAFSPDGRFVLTGSGNDDSDSGRTSGCKDCSARLWDVTTGKEIRQFVGHARQVSSVTFSPDGQFVLTGSHDKSVRLWNVADGKEVRRFNEHTAQVNSVAFSPDGALVLSGDGDFWSSTTALLWDVTTTKVIHRFGGHKHGICSVAFSPDGRLALTGSDNPDPNHLEAEATVLLWDVATGKEVRHFKGYGPVAFSPDGSQILTTTEDQDEAQVWKAETGVEVKRFATADSEAGFLESAAFSPNGDFVVLALGQKTGGGNTGDLVGKVSLRLYTVTSGKELRRFESLSSELADDLEFSSNGRFLLSGNGVWDVKAGNEIQFKGYAYNESELALAGGSKYAIARRALSKDGRLALTLSSINIVQLWDAAVGKEMFQLNGKVTGLSDVAAFWFAPDGRFFFILGEIEPTPDAQKRWTLSCWRIREGKRLWSFTFIRDLWMHANRQYSRANTDCTLSPDGRLFAIREHKELLEEAEESLDGITLLNAENGQVVRRLRVPVDHFFVHVLAFSADNRFLVTGEGDNRSSVMESIDHVVAKQTDVENVSLYDIAANKVVRRFRVTSNPETAVAFSPDGRFLLTGGYQVPPESPRFSDVNVVQLWDIATGKEVHKLHNQSSRYAAFSLDSRFLLTTDNSDGKSVHLWELSTGKEVRRLEGHTDSITSILASPDGRFVVTGSADHTERVWSISTGQELCRLVSLRNGDWIVTTPDGRFDTNNFEDIRGLHWVISDEPLKPQPLEIFMRQYYEPRLLARVVAGEKFKPLPSLAELNRTQPDVKISDIKPDSADTVQVTLEVANVKSAVQKNAAGQPIDSGAFDVRLFRDGQLVGYAPQDADKKEASSLWSWFTAAPANDGEVELKDDGRATLTFPKIKLPRTGVEQVEFSAYAFNYDRIKSATGRKSYNITPKLAPIKGRAYVVSVGVNAYERDGLDLRYAANDARQVQESLAGRLAAQGVYGDIVSVPLVSDYAVTLIDGRTVTAQDATIQEVREGREKITENRATKAHLRAVLDVLAGRQADLALLKEIPNADKLRAARPEDLVLISASGHGYTDSDGIFYLVMSDTGTASLSSPEFRGHCVSSDELSRWLRDVDAGELVMIVDACHSSAAVEGTDFKPGPMGSRGLGQLSYDKGMKILTATQADNVAMETNQVRQGLLTYALLNDGLGAWLADYKPQDNQITLTEWLGYGVDRVPHLYEEVKAGAMRVSDTGTNLNDAARIIRDTVDPRESDNDKTQQPSLFDFARRRQDVVLARKL